MPELVSLYNSGNSAVHIEKKINKKTKKTCIFCLVALIMKVENHLGYKITLTPVVTSYKVQIGGS